MPATISDGDIEIFLQRNAREYPSQISLIQATVRLLWPNGPPTGGAERVVRVCLGQKSEGSRALASSPHLPAQLMQPR
jgi:hypothetical protein